MDKEHRAMAGVEAALESHRLVNMPIKVLDSGVGAELEKMGSEACCEFLPISNPV